MAMELRDLEAEAEADKGTVGGLGTDQIPEDPSTTTSTSEGGTCEEAVTPDALPSLPEDRRVAASATKVETYRAPCHVKTDKVPEAHVKQQHWPTPPFIGPDLAGRGSRKRKQQQYAPAPVDMDRSSEGLTWDQMVNKYLTMADGDSCTDKQTMMSKFQFLVDVVSPGGREERTSLTRRKSAEAPKPRTGAIALHESLNLDMPPEAACKKQRTMRGSSMPKGTALAFDHPSMSAKTHAWPPMRGMPPLDSPAAAFALLQHCMMSSTGGNNFYPQGLPMLSAPLAPAPIYPTLPHQGPLQDMYAGADQMRAAEHMRTILHSLRAQAQQSRPQQPDQAQLLPNLLMAFAAAANMSGAGAQPQASAPHPYQVSAPAFPPHAMQPASIPAISGAFRPAFPPANGAGNRLRNGMLGGSNGAGLGGNGAISSGERASAFKAVSPGGSTGSPPSRTGSGRLATDVQAPPPLVPVSNGLHPPPQNPLPNPQHLADIMRIIQANLQANLHANAGERP